MISPSDLTVIVPSRGRPHNIARLLQAWGATEASAACLVALDADDPALDDYLHLPGLVQVSVRSRRPIGPRLNLESYCLLAGHEMPAPAALGFMGDDHVPITACWDAVVTEALDRVASRGDDPSEVAFVWGDDGVWRGQLPTYCFMTASVVSRLGYMVPGELEHMYIDNAWGDLARGCGSYEVADILIEHRHPINDKAPWDDGYAEVAAKMEPDHNRYAAWLREACAAEVGRLRGAEE